MNVLDGLLLVIRWVHAVSAVAWVGGGIFYVLVLRPASARSQLAAEARRSIGEEFRGLVHTVMAVLLITGIILSASRLTGSGVSLYYVVVLGIKIALAFYMFYVVRFMRNTVYPDDNAGSTGWLAGVRRRLTNTTAVLVVGVLVFGLSDLLDALFEAGLSR